MKLQQRQRYNKLAKLANFASFANFKFLIESVCSQAYTFHSLWQNLYQSEIYLMPIFWIASFLAMTQLPLLWRGRGGEVGASLQRSNPETVFMMQQNELYFTLVLQKWFVAISLFRKLSFLFFPFPDNLAGARALNKRPPLFFYHFLHQYSQCPRVSHNLLICTDFRAGYTATHAKPLVSRSPIFRYFCKIILFFRGIKIVKKMATLMSTGLFRKKSCA